VKPVIAIEEMAESHDSDGENADLGLFNEPDDYYEPEKPATVTQYKLNDGRDLSLRLVGHSPLWVRKWVAVER
jgi:EEF1A N-terminal glycine/lysine methyltransferase